LSKKWNEAQNEESSFQILNKVRIAEIHQQNNREPFGYTHENIFSNIRAEKQYKQHQTKP
jgi:fructosamine-3-kinase